MIRTIDKALNHELISKTCVDLEKGVVKFRLGSIPTIITARVFKKSARKYGLEVSHRIKAPNHTLYLPGFRDCNSPGEAVHELIFSFGQDYASAVNSGHLPNESWLVPNIYYSTDAEK